MEWWNSYAHQREPTEMSSDSHHLRPFSNGDFSSCQRQSFKSSPLWYEIIIGGFTWMCSIFIMHVRICVIEARPMYTLQRKHTAEMVYVSSLSSQNLSSAEDVIGGLMVNELLDAIWCTEMRQRHYPTPATTDKRIINSRWIEDTKYTSLKKTTVFLLNALWFEGQFPGAWHKI